MISWLRRAAPDLTVANTAAAPEVSESNFSPRNAYAAVVVALCCPIILSVVINRLAITLTESPSVMVVVGPVHSGRKRTKA